MNPQGDDNNLLDCGMCCCVQMYFHHKSNVMFLMWVGCNIVQKLLVPAILAQELLIRLLFQYSRKVPSFAKSEYSGTYFLGRPYSS